MKVEKGAGEGEERVRTRRGGEGRGPLLEKKKLFGKKKLERSEETRSRWRQSPRGLQLAARRFIDASSR